MIPKPPSFPQLKKVKREFENVAFHRSVSTTNRLKLDTISNLSTKAGFSCFDWFLLSTYHGLKISLELDIMILLLLQTYWSSSLK